jgi:hypothetical protein
MYPEIRKRIIGMGLFLACLLYPVCVPAMENADCLDCHTDNEMVGDDFVVEMTPFINSAHADAGCSSCHESVTDEHPDNGITLSKASCMDCHEEVGQEYAQSGHSENASCSDCHNPHKVRGATAVSGHDMNLKCAECHDADEVANSHSEWLPQANLHISNLPCISCHTASENLVISLFIVNKKRNPEDGRLELASHEELKALVGDGAVEALVDTNSDHYISLTELRMFNRNPANKTVRLQGVMMPEKITHSIEILENRWDCSFCHASGPQAMQTSYLSLVQPDGSFRRVPAEQGAVLDALFGTPDFYMVGATRSKAMNYIGLAIICGGLVLPVGHGSLRFLTRKNRRKSEDKS